MNKFCILCNSRKTATKTFKRFKMKHILEDGNQKQQLTHFISIPFCVGDVRERYLNFKREVLDKFQDQPDFDEILFQNPNKLHMTLGVMVLPNEILKSNAIEVLKQCKVDFIDNFLENQSLKMRITGIDVLNNDPRKARVVYGKVHSSDQELWQTLSDGIVDYVAKAGIMKKEFNKVKMHITLMNTIFRRKSNLVGTRRNRAPINVSSMIKEFENYDFGEVFVDTIHLSDMRAVSSTGYYKSVHILDLTRKDT